MFFYSVQLFVALLELQQIHQRISGLGYTYIFIYALPPLPAPTSWIYCAFILPAIIDRWKQICMRVLSVNACVSPNGWTSVRIFLVFQLLSALHPECIF